MTVVRNSKRYDLEERSLRFAKGIIEPVGVLPIHSRRGRIGLWSFGFGYCLGFGASDLGLDPCSDYPQLFDTLHVEADGGGPPFPYQEYHSSIRKSSCNPRRIKCPSWGFASYAHLTSPGAQPDLPVTVHTPTCSRRPNEAYTSKTLRRAR